MMRSIRRQGFTLVETVAVLCVVAISLALALPAVQGAREDARKVKCRNNLKQIGLALHNYESAYKMFPPGWISSNQYSWEYFLLPYLDYANISSRSNYKVPIDPKNKLLQTKIDDFRCPADRGPVLAGGFGRSNLAGVIVGTPSATTATSTHGGGTFGVNFPRRMGDYADGTSNTIVVGERMSTAKAGKIVVGYEGNWVGVNPGELTVVSSPSIGLPNAKVLGAFSSSHGGGANFVVGDGSVKFLSEKINPQTFANICTVGGGEVVNDF